MSFILNKIRDFYHDTRGTAVVEFVVMVPLLATLLVALVVYFDAFRAKSTNLKAAYTISDMMSREACTDSNYIDGLQVVFDFLISAPQPTWVRVTLVQFDTGDVTDPGNDADDTYIKRWSYGTNGKPQHTDASIDSISHEIPVMPHGDSALIIETHMTYFPAFEVGIDPFDINNRIITRPRWVPPIWGCT